MCPECRSRANGASKSKAGRVREVSAGRDALIPVGSTEMNRTAVALLAALESLIAAAIGLGIALVPLTVLWAAKYNMTVSWLVFWRAACDMWLLGHGVDLRVALDAKTATALGLPGAAAPFAITIAALGCALLVVVLGLRVGRRAAKTDYPLAGVVAALATYLIVATIVTLSAQATVVRPSVWQGILLPLFVFALGVIGGVVAGIVVDPQETSTGVEDTLRDRVADLPSEVRRGIIAALRGGMAATALTLGAAGILLALTLVVHFSSVVGIYERLQTGALGGAALTLAQLAFLPNLVIWTASWLIGPGFALGTGSGVSPIGTQLGPIPSVPVFGALPQGSPAFGFLGILVPVLAGLAAAILVSARERRSEAAASFPSTGTTASSSASPLTSSPLASSAASSSTSSPVTSSSRAYSRLASAPAPSRSIASLVLTGIGIGVVAGLLLGLAAWWSSGAIGPGRLVEAGPNPLLIGSLAAAETGIAAIVGMIVGSRSREA